MERVVILGRGGAGKSTTARALGRRTGLPVIELDGLFWRPGPTATPAAEWSRVHAELIDRPRWIIDGDLGPYDAGLAARLARADTVLVLDFSLPRCAWRAARRGRENAEFWRWLLAWRVRSRPAVLRAIATHAPTAHRQVLRSPRQLRRWERTRFVAPDQRRR